MRTLWKGILDRSAYADREALEEAAIMEVKRLLDVDITRLEVRTTPVRASDSLVQVYVAYAGLCPAVSPESGTACRLPDTPAAHYAGHESFWADGLKVAWPKRDQDFRRWGATLPLDISH